VTGQAFTACPRSRAEGEAAASFYASIFKDSELGSAGRYTKARPGPAGAVIAVDFELTGQKFVVLNRGLQFTFNKAMSFQIPCIPGRGGLLLGQSVRGRAGSRPWLAEGQVRPVMVSHPWRA
jgi:hypothetical protein